jgi:hypothetical protein
MIYLCHESPVLDWTAIALEVCDDYRIDTHYHRQRYLYLS